MISDCHIFIRNTISILVLGDGNLSFSLCFLKRLIGVYSKKTPSLSSIHLIITSYDSYEQLISKYPETIHIISELTRIAALNKDFIALTILHDIDATVNLNQQLKEKNSSIDNSFNHVIFNFPHLGRENCVDHSSLIAHIMFQANAVLCTHSTSYFHLALAESQSIVWKM